MILKPFAIGIILALKLTTNQTAMKEPRFQFLLTILTCILTLNVDICFSALNCLFYFKLSATSFKFGKLRLISFDCALNYESNKTYFWWNNILVCCWTARQHGKMTGVLSKVKEIAHKLGVNEIKPGIANASN